MQTVNQLNTQQINAALLALQKELLEQIQELKKELTELKKVVENEQ